MSEHKKARWTKEMAQVMLVRQEKNKEQTINPPDTCSTGKINQILGLLELLPK